MAKDKEHKGGDKPQKGGDKPAKGEKAAKGGDKGGEKPAKAADKAAGPKKPAAPVTPPRLSVKYRQEIVPALGKKFGRTNPMSLPKLQKIVVNMGVGKALQDKKRMEQAAEQLTQITGQRANITKSRKAISGFRLREGQEIGCRVTLRGHRMYEFLDRLIRVALPR